MPFVLAGTVGINQFFFIAASGTSNPSCQRRSRVYLRSDRTQGGGRMGEGSGTRFCIPQMRGPAPRQGALKAPWNPLLRAYKKDGNDLKVSNYKYER